MHEVVDSVRRIERQLVGQLQRFDHVQRFLLVFPEVFRVDMSVVGRTACVGFENGDAARRSIPAGGFFHSIQVHPEISPGGGIGLPLFVRGQGIQHPTDDLVGHQKAPGRQVPAAVLLHRIAGLGALVQEGQKAGEPAAEAALKCLGVQTRRGKIKIQMLSEKNIVISIA